MLGFRLSCGPDPNVSSLASYPEPCASSLSRTLRILRVEFLQLGLRRLLGLRIVVSSVFVAVLRRAPHFQFQILRPSPRACFACGGTSSVVGPAARLVGVGDLIRAFGVGVGQHSRRGHNRNLRTHHSLRLTSGIGLSLSLITRVLGNSTRCADDDDEDELSLDLSGFRELVVMLVQVSGVACVSHDAVRSVPGTRVLPVSRATMKFLNVSLVPAFGLFSLPLRHSLSQQCARGLSLTYQPDPSVPRSVSFMESLS